jgi:hypothetical protein
MMNGLAELLPPRPHRTGAGAVSGRVPQLRRSTGRRQRPETECRMRVRRRSGSGSRKSDEGSAMMRRRRMNLRPSGGEDWTRIEAARECRGSPAVANEFRSCLIKKFNFFHFKSNRTPMIEFRTRGSMYRHLSASVTNLLVFHTSHFAMYHRNHVRHKT